MSPRGCSVVPDKLAIYQEHFPEPLQPEGPRPIELLLDGAPFPIMYPMAELKAVGGGAYRRTDAHLSLMGYEILYTAVVDVRVRGRAWNSRT
jgi:hypothetical protein